MHPGRPNTDATLDGSAENVYGSSSELESERDKNHGSNAQRSTTGGVTVVEQNEAKAQFGVHWSPCDSRDVNAGNVQYSIKTINTGKAKEKERLTAQAPS